MKLPFATPTLHAQFFADKNFTAFMTEREIYEASGNLKIRVPLTEEGEKILKTVGKMGEGIIREIAKVEGVEMFVPYKPDILVVHAKEGADWEKMMPAILDIIDKREVSLKDGEPTHAEDWNVLTRLASKEEK